MSHLASAITHTLFSLQEESSSILWNKMSAALHKKVSLILCLREDRNCALRVHYFLSMPNFTIKVPKCFRKLSNSLLEIVAPIRAGAACFAQELRPCALNVLACLQQLVTNDAIRR